MGSEGMSQRDTRAWHREFLRTIKDLRTSEYLRSEGTALQVNVVQDVHGKWKVFLVSRAHHKGF